MYNILYENDIRPSEIKADGESLRKELQEEIQKKVEETKLYEKQRA